MNQRKRTANEPRRANIGLLTAVGAHGVTRVYARAIFLRRL